MEKIMDISGIISPMTHQAAAMRQSRQESSLVQFNEILERTMNSSEEREVLEREQIRKAAEMFEAYFLQIMFREMRNTTFDEGGLFPRTQAERIFTDMLDEEVANQAASSPNNFGLADMIYAQMTRHLSVDSAVRRKD